jgi:hypothetical protein
MSNTKPTGAELKAAAQWLIDATDLDCLADTQAAAIIMEALAFRTGTRGEIALAEKMEEKTRVLVTHQNTLQEIAAANADWLDVKGLLP